MLRRRVVKSLRFLKHRLIAVSKTSFPRRREPNIRFRLRGNDVLELSIKTTRFEARQRVLRKDQRCGANSADGALATGVGDAATGVGALDVLAAAWRFAAGEQKRFLPARLASYSA